MAGPIGAPYYDLWLKEKAEVERLKARVSDYMESCATRDEIIAQQKQEIEAALAQCKEIQRAEDMGERITAGYAIGRIWEALTGGREK